MQKVFIKRHKKFLQDDTNSFYRKTQKVFIK